MMEFWNSLRAVGAFVVYAIHESADVKLGVVAGAATVAFVCLVFLVKKILK